MDVHVVDGATVFAVTHFVFQRAAAVLYAVDYVVAAEEGQDAEYAGAVHGLEVGLEVGQADGMAGAQERVEHEEAVGG